MMPAIKLRVPLAGAMYHIDELVAFDTVMSLGSLTRSARQLGLAKSTLSRRIAHLEQQLGQPLLRRQSNRLLPTEAGQVFHRYCQQILALAEQGHQALDKLQDEISGELQLAIHSELGSGWLTPRLGQFLQRYPTVRLMLSTCSTPPVDADNQGVSIWLGSACHSEQRQEVLGQLSCGIYAHPAYFAQHGYPRHPRDLIQHAWLSLAGVGEQGVTLKHAEHDSFYFQPADSRLRSDHLTLHGDAIAAGYGLGLLPDWLAAARERAHPGSLIRCLDEWHVPSMPVTLLYPYGSQPRRLTALLTFLRQAVPPAWVTDFNTPENQPTPSTTVALHAAATLASRS